MKSLWKCFACMAVLVLLASACGPTTPTEAAQNEQAVPSTEAGVPTVAPTVKATDAPKAADAIAHPVIVAVPIDTSPEVDGSSTDEQYKGAPVTFIGSMSWQAVYTDTQLTMLIKWPDRKLILGNSGDFKWNPDTNEWTVVDVRNSSIYLNPAFAINAPSLGVEGCASFCHADSNGQFHHSFTDPSYATDSWMLLGKHGFWLTRTAEDAPYKIIYSEVGLKKSPEDVGMQIGSLSAVQNGPMIFDSLNNDNPNSILAGNISLVGYAEDNVIVGANSTIDQNQKRDRPRDLYCQNCHSKLDFTYNPLESDLTYPGEGEIQYYGNYDAPYTSPMYMEKAPVDFVDAMILHQDEIDSGEAVLVADLTSAQISEYWSNYAALNAEIPVTIHKLPTGQNAQILLGANWTNGMWTLEVQRNMVTDHPESDVQFNDFAKDYVFTMSGSGPTYGDMSKGAILRFQPR